MFTGSFPGRLWDGEPTHLGDDLFDSYFHHFAIALNSAGHSHDFAVSLGRVCPS